MTRSSGFINILVVEDDAIIAKGLELRLKRMDYGVAGIALRGEDAITLAEETRPDIVLMDIDLGAGMDGVEAAAAIRRLLDAPVIFLTAYSDDDTIRRALLTDPFGYVLKPYDDKDLQTAIEIGVYKHGMQKRLRENEQWLSATLTSIGEGVIATDQDGKVRLMNVMAQRMTGWSNDEATGRHIVEVLNTVSETTGESVANPVVEVLATGKTVNLAPGTALLDRNAEQHPIDDSAAPILDEEGNITGAVVVFRDISEKRKLEELLRHTQKMESLGRLAGGIAHDFNNLLTIILGNCDMLSSGTESAEETNECLQTISNAARGAASLTQQIVSFSRKQALDPYLLHINDSVQDLVTMMRRIIGSDIKLSVALDPEVGLIRMDPTQLGQVILNLVVNARDAMPAGGAVEIKTSRAALAPNVLASNPDLQPGIHAVLSVADTGEGIPPELLERIFEPFFTTKDVGKGTGLGLATVYGIVTQSGGHVEASSTVGEGTTFRIYLPVVEDLSLPDEQGERPIEGGEETILIVEDNDVVRAIAKRVLGNLGYHILEARNGRAGVDTSVAYVEKIDLLLTDLVMPEMGGRPAAEAIIKNRPDTKVLYMSGYSEDVVIRAGIETSSLHFLRKPFTREELAHKVRDVLDEAPASD